MPAPLDSAVKKSAFPLSDAPAFGSGPLLIILGQLLLVAWVLNEVDLLAPAYRQVVYLAIGGVAVNYWLPSRVRLPFFVALSIVALPVALGFSLAATGMMAMSLPFLRAAVLLACGLAVIGICRLPFGFWTRAALLTLAGGVLAVFRHGLAPSGDLGIVWIVLASMFMFRVIVYMYDLSTAKTPPSTSQTLAYFFLMPNACSTLFPVIDFRTFCRSHKSDRAVAVYGRGVTFLTRGIVQLLIYRYVNLSFTTTASTVYSGKTLLLFVVANSLLYLNVSGQFHFITGLLMLFGFDLPATNRRYFLASSFADYWRRVNIYWKDFMVKVFYYPCYFRLKRLGSTNALVLATAWVFLVTWVFHLYQTWWLRGSASVTLPDVLFWSILGVLVLANSLWEMRRPATRPSGATRHSWGQALRLAVQTAATFASISILWSLWSSPTVSIWIAAWRHADRNTLLGGLAVLGFVGATKIVLDAPPWQAREVAGKESPTRWRSPMAILQTAMPLLAILLVTRAAASPHLPDLRLDRFDPRWATDRLADVLETGESLPPDTTGAAPSYYQQLVGVDEANRQWLEAQKAQVLPRTLSQSLPIEDVHDYRMWVLKPGINAAAFETEPFRTNRFGMRDDEYAHPKPVNTARIALLGSSHVMGWGVRKEEMFEARLETRFNDRPDSNSSGRVEVLNFAVYGYSLLSQLAALSSNVAPFKPDVVLVVGHTSDYRFVGSTLRHAQRGHLLTDAHLTEILARAHVKETTNDGLAMRRLRQFDRELMTWTLRRLVEGARALGAQPVFVFLPVPGFDLPDDSRTLVALASEAGFKVYDLAKAFDGRHASTLKTVGMSPHMNPLAHAIVADSLWRAIRTDTAGELSRLARFGVDSGGTRTVSTPSRVKGTKQQALSGRTLPFDRTGAWPSLPPAHRPRLAETAEASPDCSWNGSCLDTSGIDRGDSHRTFSKRTLD